MDQILQQVAESQMMSLLGVLSHWNYICLKKNDKFKTTFTNHWGTFSYEHMPFGVINVGATFQREM